MFDLCDGSDIGDYVVFLSDGRNCNTKKTSNATHITFSNTVGGKNYRQYTKEYGSKNNNDYSKKSKSAFFQLLFVFLFILICSAVVRRI